MLLHLTGLLLLASLMPVFTLTAQVEPAEDFTLVREDGVISMYERWIILPGSNPPVEAREVKAQFTVQSTPAEALALLKNEKRIQEWQAHVSEFKIFKQQDTTTWYEYSYHDIPWPVSDQDHFIQYKISTNLDKELWIVFETQKNETLAPVRKGVARLYLKGSWKFETLGNNQLKATYRIMSKPSGIPKIFTDPVVRNNMMTTITSFIEILEKNQAPNN